MRKSKCAAALLIIAVLLLGSCSFAEPPIEEVPNAETVKIAESTETAESTEIIKVAFIEATVKNAEPVEIATIAYATPKPEPEPEEPGLVSLGVFRITAYCPCVRCCGIWSAEHPSRIGTDFVQRTASGTIPTAGRTIAVDTSVIPFGTVIFIDGREYVAEDRGGAIRGNRIDIFFNCHQEALNWGVQRIEVFIKYEGGQP